MVQITGEFVPFRNAQNGRIANVDVGDNSVTISLPVKMPSADYCIIANVYAVSSGIIMYAAPSGQSTADFVLRIYEWNSVTHNWIDPVSDNYNVDWLIYDPTNYEQR